ncbi:MAG: DUF2934 domain-containing protein [Verrucomicrobia bacterium]|nr:DUF2934 domain-containing protein [Verrucomicrobiota bacterium]
MPTKKTTKTGKTATTATSRAKNSASRSVATKTARSKTPATKRATKPAAVPAPSAAVKAAGTQITVATVAPSKPAVTGEKRFQMIQLEAYLIAEKDGFRSDPHGYWVAAEQRVAAMLKG